MCKAIRFADKQLPCGSKSVYSDQFQAHEFLHNVFISVLDVHEEHVVFPVTFLSLSRFKKKVVMRGQTACARHGPNLVERRFYFLRGDSFVLNNFVYTTGSLDLQCDIFMIESMVLSNFRDKQDDPYYPLISGLLIMSCHSPSIKLPSLR